MLVIFDTNILLSELALNTRRGSVVRFFLRQKNAVCAVPEVVHLELQRNLKTRLREKVNLIKKAHREILSVFGTLDEMTLPTDEEIDNKVEGILSNLGVPTREVPFSLSAAKSSFLKTIDKVPPSDRSQQFKDGLIWAHCVELLADDDVHFVTSDKAFFDDYTYAKGPARNLLKETEGLPYELSLFSNLADFLEEIREDVEVDKNKLIEAYLAEQKASTETLLERTGFRMGANVNAEVKVFATEAATRLFVEFVVHVQCSDATELSRSDACLSLKGSGSYSIENQEYTDLRSDRATLRYLDDEGEKSFGSLTGRAGFNDGKVHHTIRSLLS